MTLYNKSYTKSPAYTTDYISILVFLRKDIHTAFNRERLFAIVAKEGSWIVDFLDGSEDSYRYSMYRKAVEMMAMSAVTTDRAI